MPADKIDRSQYYKECRVRLSGLGDALIAKMTDNEVDTICFVIRQAERR